MYSRILVPVDLDEPSSWEKAVPTAQALADTFGAQLAVCTVVPDSETRLRSHISAETMQGLLDKASARLMSLVRELGMPDVDTEVGMGNIAGGILAVADKVQADLIVLSSHRPEMKDWLIGANAARVVRHAGCSVMVVRD